MKNRDGYSFGGKTKFGTLHHHQNAYSGLVDPNPGYYQSTNKWTKSIDESSSQCIHREYNQHVNDYTKNISQSIFSPGLVKSKPANRQTKTPGKYNRNRLAGQRRSIGHGPNYPQNMKQYHPLRPNALQLNANQKPQSAGKSFKSAKSLSRMINREKRYSNFNRHNFDAACFSFTRL